MGGNPKSNNIRSLLPPGQRDNGRMRTYQSPRLGCPGDTGALRGLEDTIEQYFQLLAWNHSFPLPGDTVQGQEGGVEISQLLPPSNLLSAPLRDPAQTRSKCYGKSGELSLQGSVLAPFPHAEQSRKG